MLAYIDWIESKKFVILGGDVYYSPKNKDNDSLESISVAKNYINQYVDSNGKYFYFAVVVSE